MCFDNPNLYSHMLFYFSNFKNYNDIVKHRKKRNKILFTIMKVENFLLYQLSKIKNTLPQLDIKKKIIKSLKFLDLKTKLILTSNTKLDNQF